MPINEIISTVGGLFVSEGLVNGESASVDSSMLKASGPVWHKSDIKKNHLPIAGIDTNAKWGFSKSKGWAYGYKLHMSCSTGRLVPLSACVTAANVHDSKPYEKLIESLSGLMNNIWCDPAYDDSKLYESTKNNAMRLICPVKKYHSMPTRPNKVDRVLQFSSWSEIIFSEKNIN